jgi:hypothetical protein
MIEKDVKEKEVQNEKEIDPHLKELIEVMKAIKKEMPDFEKEERITVFLEYTRERKNSYVDTEKQNTNEINLESLVNALSFRTSKNGTSLYATLDPKIAQKLPREFEIKDDKFFVKKDSKTPVIIKVKKKASQ